MIVRLSDFKTNEYASLLGGAGVRAEGRNPMLGFRGASRYAHPAYADGFALECAALKRVRDEMGLTNLKLMVPFCRRVEEAQRVIAAMARHGLKRGENGLEIYVMCEIPNNVIRIDAFAAAVRRLLDRLERSDPAHARRRPRLRDRRLRFRRARSRHDGDAAAGGRRARKRNRRHVGICGEAPANYPEIAAVPGAARHRFDQRQPVEPAAHDRGGAGGEEHVRPRAAAQ